MWLYTLVKLALEKLKQTDWCKFSVSLTIWLFLCKPRLWCESLSQNEREWENRNFKCTSVVIFEKKKRSKIGLVNISFRNVKFAGFTNENKICKQNLLLKRTTFVDLLIIWLFIFESWVIFSAHKNFLVTEAMSTNILGNIGNEWEKESPSQQWDENIHIT